MAENHLAEIETKIAELQHMQQVLNALATSCRGDSSPDCSILQQLAKGD
jgi:hypothetical protein